MPEARVEFTIKAPIIEVWQLLSNMEGLGLCIPGCKEVKQVSENEYDWILQVKVLHTSRTISARTRATEMVPPSHVSFTGDGKLREGLGFYKVALRGSMDLASVTNNETKVIFDGSVSAGGIGGAIINKIASGQMKGLIQDFEQNVRSKLEK